MRRTVSSESIAVSAKLLKQYQEFSTLSRDDSTCDLRNRWTLDSLDSFFNSSKKIRRKKEFK